jgi:hypothetical protein
MNACCTTPKAICYWATVSFPAWIVFAIIGRFWAPLHASSAATCFFAVAVGCFANALKNRVYHCILTGPLFLVAGVLLLFSNLGVLRINPNLITTVALVGTGLAFVTEWRFARRTTRPSS